MVINVYGTRTVCQIPCVLKDTAALSPLTSSMLKCYEQCFSLAGKTVVGKLPALEHAQLSVCSDSERAFLLRRAASASECVPLGLPTVSPCSLLFSFSLEVNTDLL